MFTLRHFKHFTFAFDFPLTLLVQSGRAVYTYLSCATVKSAWLRSWDYQAPCYGVVNIYICIHLIDIYIHHIYIYTPHTHIYIHLIYVYIYTHLIINIYTHTYTIYTTLEFHRRSDCG